jgi:molybdopterin-guanine dinucleotide biosynthesis protein A
MRVFGAILAGGRSSRFGSDKALALLDGRPLIDWTREALVEQVDGVVICGRDGGLADRPLGRLGPLAGLNAALHAGRDEGFDAVLSVPCDAPMLPADLLYRLRAGGAPAYLAAMPVIGLWPCALAGELDLHLRGDDRSMRGWARRIGAAPVTLDTGIANVNEIGDLERLGAPHS